MQIRIKTQFILFLAGMAVLASSIAGAESKIAVGNPYRTELALEYNYVHANAPPGDCGCFSLNGGSATFAMPIRGRSIMLVGDASVSHSSSISANNYSLTLSAFTAGVRYSPHIGHTSLQPFGQVLAGVAHSSGSLVDGAVSNSGAAFAANLGGGLDLRAGHRVSIRLIEADYLVTTFNNGDNDHQNNLRIGTGLAFHF